MQFLTDQQWPEWCAARGILVDQDRHRPCLDGEQFHHRLDLIYPADSGQKVALSRELWNFISSPTEALLLIQDFQVWPSSQHLPLFLRFRQALGETRPLEEAPAHLASSTETDDALSIVALSLLFFWDCFGISADGQSAFFISHDEYCYVSTRQPALLDQISERWRQELAD